MAGLSNIMAQTPNSPAPRSQQPAARASSTGLRCRRVESRYSGLISATCDDETSAVDIHIQTLGKTRRCTCEFSVRASKPFLPLLLSKYSNIGSNSNNSTSISRAPSEST